MYEDENPYLGYDSNGLTPQDLLAMIVNLQSRMASTISFVKREDGNLLEKQSQILQTIDEITLQVLEIETGFDYNTALIGELSVQAGKIEASVAAMDSRVGAAETSLTLLPGLLSSKVSLEDFNGNKIMSLIEQTPLNIKLSAQRIDLDGVTYVNGNLEIGRGWEAGAVNGAKRIRFGNAGELVWYDGFEYRSSVHGHDFFGDVRFAEGGYYVDFSKVEVRGLNVTLTVG